MSDVKKSYPASADLTFTSLASLATSSDFTAGAEATAYDNTSNLYLDVKLAGKIKVGTTPTANTQINVYVFAEQKDGSWPDVMDGTDSAETWTNAQMLAAGAKLAATIDVVATTSDLAYPFECGSVAALFGGVLPRKFGVFVAHNTGVNLNATQTAPVSVMPSYETVT